MTHFQGVHLLKLVRKRKQRASAKEAKETMIIKKRTRPSKAQRAAKQLLAKALAKLDVNSTESAATTVTAQPMET